jgi:hypothetical protein
MGFSIARNSIFHRSEIYAIVATRYTFWIGLIVWLKGRIIDSFVHIIVRTLRTNMNVDQQPQLKDLPQLPIQEAD